MESDLFKTLVAGERLCSVRQGRANQGQWHEKTSSANNILRLLCVCKKEPRACVYWLFIYFLRC